MCESIETGTIETGLRSGKELAEAEERRLERHLSRWKTTPKTVRNWKAPINNKPLTLPTDTMTDGLPPEPTSGPVSKPAKTPRARSSIPVGRPPHPRKTEVDPNEDPSTYADMTIFELRPFKVVDGNDTAKLMQNFAYMLDQPVHKETAARADAILAKAKETKIPPSPEANEQIKAWRMLGSATMKSSTQAKQAAKNWEETDRHVTEKALDPSFKATPEELLTLMEGINAKLLPGIMVKEGDHEVPAKPGMRVGEQAAAGMDTGGQDLNPTRMYIPGSEVENAMKEMCGWLSAELAKEDTNPIELAARAYQEVVTIHPFHDANGRSARFVMDFVLQRKGLLPAALGEDVNLCCFPRIDPDHQPSPTGALNVVMKGVERSYAQVSGKKKPAGPLPALPEDPKTLLVELTKNKELFASYEVPVDILISQFNTLDTLLNGVKDAEWPAKQTEIKGKLSELKKSIGSLPVLRKELGKLSEFASERVETFDDAAAGEEFRGKAPKSAKEWTEADTAVLAGLLKVHEAKVTSVQEAIADCLDVKPVAKLEDVGVPFDGNFDRWSQQVDEQLTKRLGDVISTLNQQISTGLPKYAQTALTAVAKTFETDLAHRKELLRSGLRPLYEQLASAAGVSLGGPSEEETKLARLAAIRKLKSYVTTQSASWGADATELLDLCEELEAKVDGGDTSGAQSAATALKERADRLSTMRASNFKRNGALSLFEMFELS
jgi:hypothetical protein